MNYEKFMSQLDEATPSKPISNSALPHEVANQFMNDLPSRPHVGDPTKFMQSPSSNPNKLVPSLNPGMMLRGQKKPKKV
jgi:hypothetical protein